MEKLEFLVKMYPPAFEVMDNVCNKTGVSKDEIIEKLFLTYVPLQEDRAVEVIKDDIATRTGRLSREQQKNVYKKILRYLKAELE